jgi:hypothetical protein
VALGCGGSGKSGLRKKVLPYRAIALGCGVQSIGLISWTEMPTVGAGWGCDRKRKSIRLYNQKDHSSFIDRATRVSI